MPEAILLRSSHLLPRAAAHRGRSFIGCRRTHARRKFVRISSSPRTSCAGTVLQNHSLFFFTTCNIGVLYYLLERDRDLVRTTAIDRYLPLRGPPGPVPSACQPPWSSQTLTASTDNTILIQSEVRGFVLAPSRGPASAGKGSRSVRRRPPCPCSDTATCPASRSSSNDRFWLFTTPPRAGLESFLDDQLDPEKMKVAGAHGRPVATKRSTYNH